MYPHRKSLISLFRNNDQTLRNGQSDKAEYAGISRNSYISIVKGNLSPFLIHKINDGQKGKEETGGNLGPGYMVGRSAIFGSHKTFLRELINQK